MIYPIKSSANRIPITDTGTLKRFIDSPISKTSAINAFIDRGDETKVPLAIDSGTLKTVPGRGAIEYNGKGFYITKENRTRYGVKGCIGDDVEDVGNVSGVLTTIKEYSLKESTFQEKRDKVTVNYAGIIAGNGDMKNVLLYFNDVLIFETKDFTFADESAWYLSVKLIASTDVSIKFACSFTCNNQNNSTPFVSTGYYLITSIDFTAIHKIYLKGLSANDLDIVHKFSEAFFIPQLNP